MKLQDFTVVPAVILFVIGGVTYNAYTEFCDCIEKLEKQVASYNEKAMKEMREARIEAETKQYLLLSRTQQEPKSDWLLANLQEDFPKTLGEMHDAGIPVGMFEIASEDEYWSIDRFRAKFTDEDGVERKDLFQAFYKQQYDRYNSYRVGEMSLLNYNTASNVTAKRSGNETPQTVIIKGTPDPWDRSYSSLTGWSTGTLNEQCKTENLILKLFGVANHF